MKKNILLLHGALGSSSQYIDFKNLLGSEYIIHAFDFEGHGFEPSGRDFRIEYFADNILHYVQSNNLEHVSIFGYSMGGYAALYAATQNPGMFNHIITLGTKFYWTKEYAEREVRYLQPEVMKQKVPAFAQLLEERHGSHWKDVVHKTSEMMLHLGNHPLLTNELLSTIETTAYIGVGDKDNTVTVDETYAVSKALNNGALFVLPGTPHPLEKANLEMIKAIILDSL